ncbi:2Fe-2S iron-sulfur cluster-binding protein [Streptacidiphilus sp. N1-3]|uniref:2Fe-2S iron-sulfur cluster-binding protein n=1 Tax=Streptacidiphilus alkalitolerans TaxID=3342712 RepID=A0ABV6WSU5_9ACTN
MTDYLTNPVTLGMAESMGATGFGSSDESPRVSYTLRVNGLDRPVDGAWIGESLLYVLRERLGLAGAKGGCDQGECGACSVQLDGQLTAACLVPAALAADSEIRTVEGLSTNGSPSDVQRALAESGAVQCGYCVPGLAMAVHDLLERNHQPTDLQAREALCGNLCRCTGYSGALAAVQTVARAREAASSVPDPETESGSESDGTAEAAGPEESAAAAPEPPTGPVEAEQPVYVDLPAQQSAEPEPPAEPDPLFGPLDGSAGPATASQVPQYAGYPEGEPQPYYQAQADDYQTGQFQLPDYGTGQFPVLPVPEYGTGDYSTGEYSGGDYRTGEFATGEFPTGEYATGEYAAAPNGYPAPAELEPGVYVLPHQQQQQHTHSSAPEAGA